MADRDHHTAWSAYQDAVGNLYGQPLTSIAERGDGDIADTHDLVDRAQVVVDRSLELGQATAQGLTSSDSGQRELAEMQLLAAAAVDLAVASDLAGRVMEGVFEQTVKRGPLLPAAVAELQATLSAPPERGIRGL
ncbi:MAG TPA: hypothetical protein VM537_07520, partial [Anaerolineae bacterium]|nr:hypothetical protein [Anaerolineae bacterium]